MKKGVLMLALGHPNYGNMAATLAASIRYTSPDVHITLIYAGDAINYFNEQKRALFDSIRKAPAKVHTYNGNREAYIKAKVHLYELSAYDQTLFIDVDMLWLYKRPIDELFDELAGVSFTIQNDGFWDMANKPQPSGYVQWCSLKDVAKAYKLRSGKFYRVFSELIYFERSEAARALFERAQEIYENPLCPVTEFAGALPDEFAFSMAMIKEKLYPHQDEFYPIYWQPRDKHKPIDVVADNYYGLSIGGSVTHSVITEQYNRLAKGYFSKLGLQNPYRVLNKKRWNNNRLTV